MCLDHESRSRPCGSRQKDRRASEPPRVPQSHPYIEPASPSRRTPPSLRPLVDAHHTAESFSLLAPCVCQIPNTDQLPFALEGVLSCFERIVEQHADRHRTDATGDRRNPCGALLRRFKLDIAGQLPTAKSVYSDIDHNRTGLDPLATN